jgi:4-carboxymuconolactone decarboxylase
MADDKQPSGAQKLLGDFAPALVDFTDDVLFGQVWKRPSSPPRNAASSPWPA